VSFGTAACSTYEAAGNLRIAARCSRIDALLVLIAAVSFEPAALLERRASFRPVTAAMRTLTAAMRTSPSTMHSIIVDGSVCALQ